MAPQSSSTMMPPSSDLMSLYKMVPCLNATATIKSSPETHLVVFTLPLPFYVPGTKRSITHYRVVTTLFHMNCSIQDTVITMALLLMWTSPKTNAQTTSTGKTTSVVYFAQARHVPKRRSKHPACQIHQQWLPCFPCSTDRYPPYFFGTTHHACHELACSN
jgi:hypothetical protein